MPDGDRSSADSTSYHTLRPHGGYRRLRSFQVTEIIYDATVAFCDRFIDRRSRTRDQMVQAARSGRQNIAEGSRASATSGRTELRLVNGHVPAWTSFCWIARIFFASVTRPSGRGMTPGRSMSERSPVASHPQPSITHPGWSTPIRR
jgi:hypothetical protein